MLWFEVRTSNIVFKRIPCLKSKYMSYIINSEYNLYSYENVASIFGENDLKYEFGIDSSILNQEPVSRDCQAITTVCDSGNEERTMMHEQALPSIYTLQPCNPREVSNLFAYHL